MTTTRMKAVLGGALFASALLFSGCTTEVVEEAPETSPTTSSPASSPAPASQQEHAPGPGPAPAPGPASTPDVPMMPNPNGDGSMVPCEGSICTNPNHGAGDADAPPEPGQTEMQGPDGEEG